MFSIVILTDTCPSFATCFTGATLACMGHVSTKEILTQNFWIFPTSYEYWQHAENKIYYDLLMKMQFLGHLYSVCHANILILFGSKDYHNHAVSRVCLCSLNLLSFDVLYVTSSFFAVLLLHSHLCPNLQRDLYSAKNFVCGYFFLHAWWPYHLVAFNFFF